MRLPGLSTSLPFRNQSGGAPPIPPANTVAPIISGTNVVGDVLTTTNGTWTGTAPITYTYQWYRGAAPIALATASTYILVDADAGVSNIKCRVTATNTAGSAGADSNIITDIYTILAADFFARVKINNGGVDPLSNVNKSGYNTYTFIPLTSGSYGATVDDMYSFAHPNASVEIAARTSILGNFLAIPFGSPTWSTGIGYTHNGTSYIDWGFNPAVSGVAYTLNKCGIYHSISLIHPTGSAEYFTAGCNDTIGQIVTLDRYQNSVYFSLNSKPEATPITIGSVDISNYQIKRSTSLAIKFKNDNAAEQTQTLGAVATTIPNMNIFSGAWNNSGAAMNVPSGSIEKCLTIGDDSMDKDTLQAILI